MLKALHANTRFNVNPLNVYSEHLFLHVKRRTSLANVPSSCGSWGRVSHPVSTAPTLAGQGCCPPLCYTCEKVSIWSRYTVTCLSTVKACLGYGGKTDLYRPQQSTELSGVHSPGRRAPQTDLDTCQELNSSCPVTSLTSSESYVELMVPEIAGFDVS